MWQVLLTMKERRSRKSADSTRKENIQKLYSLGYIRRMHSSLRDPHSGFITAVYWQPGDVSVSALRDEFLRMKDARIDAVRFHNANPVEEAPGHFNYDRMDQWFEAARQAELPVILHTNLVEPSAAYLQSLEIAPAAFEHLEADDPDFIRAVRGWMTPVLEHLKDHPYLFAWGLNGEPDATGLVLHPELDRKAYARWLEEQYGSVEELNRIWMPYPDAENPLISSFDRAVDLYQSNDRSLFDGNPGLAKRYYAAMRDRMRFQADRMVSRAHACCAIIREVDDSRPTLNGSHNMMYNQPIQGWDTEGWAKTADVHFTSIHLPWHFEPVHGEVDLPHYLHARMTRDFNKGGFNSPYETTGGAVMYSGGYGNSMSPELMRRMMLSYLAAENDAIGFWVWNHRVACWEVGEYGLSSLSGSLTPWSREMTRVAEAFQDYKAELRLASAKPKVGILYSWNTEAVLSLEPERFEDQEGPTDMSRGVKVQHQRALTGAARMLADANLPFEYITEAEVESGDLPYDLIILPHCRALSTSCLEALAAYVEAGGKILGDVQTAFTDPWGKLHSIGRGGALDQLFGAWYECVHDARTEIDLSWNGEAVKGFFGDLEVTQAQMKSRFSDGRTALSCLRKGRGEAWMLASDPFRSCADPEEESLRSWMTQFLQSLTPPDWQSSLPLSFRLQGAEADHWFILNAGKAHSLTLRVHDREDLRWVDVLSGNEVGRGPHLLSDLPAGGSLWLRAERVG